MARRKRTEAEELDQPQEETVEAQVAAPVSAEGVTLAQAFERLKEAQNMPTSNQEERQERANRIAAAQEVCAAVQRGLPILAIDADGYAAAHSSNAEAMRLKRLEIAARTNLDVSWLLTEYRKLTDQ